LRINYLSLSSGSKKREIVPVALADNGMRWHVRGYDRERDRFGEFVVTRIAKAQRLRRGGRARNVARRRQWARMVDMELVPIRDQAAQSD